MRQELVAEASVPAQAEQRINPVFSVVTHKGESDTEMQITERIFPWSVNNRSVIILKRKETELSGGSKLPC